MFSVIVAESTFYSVLARFYFLFLYVYKPLVAGMRCGRDSVTAYSVVVFGCVVYCVDAAS